MSSNSPSRLYIKARRIDSHIESVTSSIQRLIFSGLHKREENLKKRRIIFAIIFLILFSVLGSIISNHGKAETAIFYPNSCLGGWENINKATGKPETQEGGIFSDLTSAILPQNSSAEIYCGEFKGEIPNNSVPSRLMLRVVWSKDGQKVGTSIIESSNFASSTQEILDTPASSTPIIVSTTTEAELSTTTETTEGIATSTNEQIMEQAKDDRQERVEEKNTTPITESIAEPATQPVVEPTPQPVVEPTIESVVPVVEEAPQASRILNYIFSFFRNMIESAYAQEVATGTENRQTIDDRPETTEDTQISTVELKTEEKILNTKEETQTEVIASTTSIDIATSTEFSTSTENASTTNSSSTDILATTTEIIESQNVITALFEVEYTFDGKEWISLGKVNQNELQSAQFEIPMNASSTWGDLSLLQIHIKRLSSLDNVPDIYLDGLVLEVETINLSKEEIIGPDFERDTILSDITSDGMRIVAIINADTNEREDWYMYVEEVGTSTPFSTSTIVLEMDNATTTTSISTTTNLNATTTNSTSSIGSLTEVDGVSSTTTDEAIDNSTTTIIKEKKKNIWFKYEGGVVAPVVSDIVSFDESKITKEESKINEKIEVVLNLLPDFAADRIKRIKGNFLNLVVIQVKGEKDDELWLYDIENETQNKIEVGSSTTVSSDFPFGIKGGFLFWLSQDKRFVYAYNPVTKVFFEKEIPALDSTNGERAEIHFEEIKWKVIINNENFTFFSNETGEVFSDEDSQSLNNLRQKINLDVILNEEKLNKLDFSVEDVEEASVTGE